VIGDDDEHCTAPISPSNHCDEHKWRAMHFGVGAAASSHRKMSVALDHMCKHTHIKQYTQNQKAIN